MVERPDLPCPGFGKLVNYGSTRGQACYFSKLPVLGYCKIPAAWLSFLNDECPIDCLVHEGGYAVQMSDQSMPQFTDPAGCTIPEVAEKSFRGNVFTLRQQNRRVGLEIKSDTPISLWEGEMMDTSMAIEGLLYRESGSEQPKT